MREHGKSLDYIINYISSIYGLEDSREIRRIWKNFRHKIFGGVPHFP
jgi:hypothetical protein